MDGLRNFQQRATEAEGTAGEIVTPVRESAQVAIQVVARKRFTLSTSRKRGCAELIHDGCTSAAVLTSPLGRRTTAEWQGRVVRLRRSSMTAMTCLWRRTPGPTGQGSLYPSQSSLERELCQTAGPVRFASKHEQPKIAHDRWKPAMVRDAACQVTRPACRIRHDDAAPGAQCSSRQFPRPAHASRASPARRLGPVPP